MPTQLKARKPNEVFITRSQLRGYGASHYLARQLTLNLTSVRGYNNAYQYTLPDIMFAIKNYLGNRRIHPKTKKILEHIREELQPQLQNVLEISFGDNSDPELKQLCLGAIRAKVEFDRKLSEAKALSASIRGLIKR